MLGFWPSDAGLLLTQAALVCGPRPSLPRAVERLRGGIWAWLMPASLGGTIAVLAAYPGLAHAYSWVAVIGIPLLAVPSIVVLIEGGRANAGLGRPAAWLVALVVAAALLGYSWGVHHGLAAQSAATALTALSSATLAAYLATVTPASWLKVGILTMAALDAVLVSAQLLQGPNDTLEAATPGAHLPHLQVAVFGSAVIGYGDVFIAAVLGTVVVGDPRLARRVRPWQGALVVLACAAVFDLLFLVVDVLPATVPVAVALVLLELWVRRSAARAGPVGVVRRAERARLGGGGADQDDGGQGDGQKSESLAHASPLPRWAGVHTRRRREARPRPEVRP
ncbi:MAG: hypothetical protein QM747_18150 [Nocardioides sp.]